MQKASQADKEKAYQAAYYQANKEKVKVQGAAYYQANKEKVNVRHAAYYQAHKNQMNKVDAKRYREKHRETIRIKANKRTLAVKDYHLQVYSKVALPPELLALMRVKLFIKRKLKELK